ncbi:glutathione S-transferase [Alphaproteobacteria bacterium 46_93_T64]|nr:glutathione S-transferase [Alphaproteobacteria bacterium 46_93_T64]
MKLYDLPGPPSPRRVRVFLAEKGVEIDIVAVNIREGAQFKPEFAAINSRLTIPALELDNGTVISETDAIQRYLEEKFPENPLFGNSPEERAVVNNWLRIIEADGFMAVAEALRNGAPRFENRALTGVRNVAQIPALGERGVNRIGYFFEDLDKQLEGRKYIAGDTFTVADINALVTVDFAGMAKQSVPDTCANIARWYADVSSRPSAQA